jgi:hypothetical protein
VPIFPALVPARKFRAVSFYGTIERACVNAIKISKIIIEHYLLAANQVDAALDLDRDCFCFHSRRFYHP